MAQSITGAVAANVDSEQNVFGNGKKSSNSRIDDNSQNSDIESVRHPAGQPTNTHRNSALSIQAKEIHSFLQRKDRWCHCEANYSEHIVQYEANRFGIIKSMTFRKPNCGMTKKVDPWWMFDEHIDVKKEIFSFLRYHNPTETLCCNVNCKADDETDIVPAMLDRFGIVSSVECINCNEEMSLEINTPNSHMLTVIEKADDLKPGDEIMFRRWYGISHHAIYTGRSESQEHPNRPNERSRLIGNGVEVWIDVISHTFDEEDARVIQSKELLGGIDVYRVEYDSCYPSKWTDWNARRAEKFAESCKKAQTLRQGSKSQDAFDSNYDPLMENCEHFARRCKTGQSESRQVKAYLYNCGKHVAMFALRIAILAIWWISEAVIEEIEISDNATMTTSKVAQEESEKVNKMELTVSMSLCILFLTLKVVFSSIKEFRKIRYQEPSTNKQNHDTNKKTAMGGYSKSCSECCRKCCPKRCNGFRYLCRMLCCLVPIRVLKEICCTGCSRPIGGTREFKCKQCCDDPILKLCCRQYAVITLCVIVSEVIVVGIPIVFFATFQMSCKFPPITHNFFTRAGYGVLFTSPLVLVLTCIHSCITNTLGRIVGWCCHRCCCCCYCCCSFKDSGN